MTQESNDQSTFKEMAAYLEQINLLNLLEDLLKDMRVGSNYLNPIYQDLSDQAKTRFDDPSFKLNWERLAKYLVNSSAQKGEDLGELSILPMKKSNKYFKLTDDVERILHKLALIDEQIS